MDCHGGTSGGLSKKRAKLRSSRGNVIYIENKRVVNREQILHNHHKYEKAYNLSRIFQKQVKPSIFGRLFDMIFSRSIGTSQKY